MTVRVARTISDAVADRGDILAGASFFHSHRWLTAIEREISDTTEYLVLDGSDDSPMAVLPCYFPKTLTARDANDRFYRPQELLPGDSRVSRLKASDVMILGSRDGYANPLCLIASEALESGGYVSELLDAAVSRAHDRGVRLIVIPFLTQDGAHRLGADVTASYGAPSLPRMTLDTHLNTFDAYLKVLNQSTRKAVRREMRAFAEEGGTIALRSLAEVVEPVADLVAISLARLGYANNRLAVRKRFEIEAEGLDSASRAFCIERRGRMSGFCLFYEWHGGLYARAAGVDYEHAPEYSYFNVSYYAPIQYAIDSRAAFIDFGPGSYEAKSRRGCAAQLTRSVVADITFPRAESFYTRTDSNPSLQEYWALELTRGRA